MTEIITHSRLRTLNQCPRKHYFKYELGLRPIDDDSKARRMGSAFHVGVERRDVQAVLDFYARQQCPENIGIEEWHVEIAQVTSMVQGYLNHWPSQGYEVLADERLFERPIKNPETGAPTPLFVHAGKQDRIVRLPDGRLALLETKTTGDSIDPGSDYWRRLELDSQVSGYLIAAHEQGQKLETIIYDVARKPAIRPRKLTKAEFARLSTSGLYGGVKIPPADQPKDFDDPRETPYMYAVRLRADIADRPEFYYARKEVPRLDWELAEWEAELWDSQKILRHRQLTNRWPRNDDSCITVYGKCAYFGALLIEHQRLGGEVPKGFHIVQDKHPELSEDPYAHETTPPATAVAAESGPSTTEEDEYAEPDDLGLVAR